MKINAKISLLLGTVSIILAYQLHPVFYKGFFYHSTAFAFCCFLYSLYQQVRGEWSLVVFSIYALSINNLIDEIFFDPKEMDWNEWISFALIILIVLQKKNKWRI